MINSISECTAISNFYGGNQQAISDNQPYGVSYDPPGCYYEDGWFKFNAGNNTGTCSQSDICLCAGNSTETPSETTPFMATTLSPTDDENNYANSSNSSYWQILSGDNVCQLVEGGRCVTDGPGNYGNYERCVVKALQSVLLTARQYHIEPRYDYVTVNNVAHRTSFPSQGVSMNEGATWTWTSDGSVTRPGYVLCAGWCVRVMRIIGLAYDYVY